MIADLFNRIFHDMYVYIFRVAATNTLVWIFFFSSAVFAEGEKATVFLKRGKPISEYVDRLDVRALEQYQKAIASFQSVDDCVDTNHGAAGQEARPMRWRDLDTLEKVEVCIFLLAAKIRNHEEMLDWFNMNDFEAILIEKPAVVMRFYLHDGDGFLVSAGAPIKGPIRVGLLNRLLGHSVTVGVTFASDGRPLDVQSAITIK